MRTRLTSALVAAVLPAGAGCVASEPRGALDPPTSTLAGAGPTAARAVFLVQNHDADGHPIRIDLRARRILDTILPASDSESGHPSIHRFRYVLADGRYRLTVAVGRRTVRRSLRLPPRERRWIVVQHYGEPLGLEVTVHRRRPIFG